MIARLLPHVGLTSSVANPWGCLAAVQVDELSLDKSSCLPLHGGTVRAHAGHVDDQGVATEATYTNIEDALLYSR